MQGREVVTILDKELQAGDHKVEWHVEGIKPGIFFYRLTTGNHSSTGKIVKVK